MTDGQAARYDPPVSNPRFQPRLYAHEPYAFGRAWTLRWKTFEPVDPQASAQVRAEQARQLDRLGAAQIQHRYAYILRRAAEHLHESLENYAETFGLNYDRLNKITRGYAIMRLEDVAQTNRLLRNVLELRDPEKIEGFMTDGSASQPIDSSRIRS